MGLAVGRGSRKQSEGDRAKSEGEAAAEFVAAFLRDPD